MSGFSRISECVEDATSAAPGAGVNFGVSFNSFFGFSAGQAFCSFSGGTAASIHSAIENAAVLSLADRVGTAYIGLTDESFSFNEGTQRFSWFDGSTFNFGNVGGEFPWASNEPDNLFGGEACVSILKSTSEGDAVWRDSPCDFFIQMICRFPCTLDPIVTPTVFPTGFPSVTPTGSPNFAPTTHPSKIPTGSPAGSPTFNAVADAERDFKMLLSLVVVVGMMLMLIALIKFIRFRKKISSTEFNSLEKLQLRRLPPRRNGHGFPSNRDSQLSGVTAPFPLKLRPSLAVTMVDSEIDSLSTLSTDLTFQRGQRPNIIDDYI